MRFETKVGVVKIRSVFLAAAVAIAGVVSAPSARADVVWTLTNVALSDGGVLNGSLTIFGTSSSGYGGLIDFHLTTTGGTISSLDATYSYPGFPSGEINAWGGPDNVVTFFPDVVPPLGAYSSVLTITFANPLDVAGPINPIIGGFAGPSYECAGWACPAVDTIRYIGADSFATSTVAAVPEASTWAMLLFGFLGMGIAARRLRSARVELSA